MGILNISEIGIISLFIIFLFYSYKKKNLWILILSLIYGFLLEEITFYQFRAYFYGNFWIFVFDIPLVVILGWGLIIYSSINTSEKLGLSSFHRALFVSLIAINLDIVMEVVAIKLGFWNWTIETQFFGVPYDNFFAWFIAIFFFAFFLKKFNYKNKIFNWLMAIFISLAILVILDEVWTYLPPSYYSYLWWSIFTFAVIKLFLELKYMKKDNKFDYYFIIPISYLIFFSGIFFYYKFHETIPYFTYILIFFIVFEILILVIPYTNSLIRIFQNLKKAIVKRS